MKVYLENVTVDEAKAIEDAVQDSEVEWMTNSVRNKLLDHNFRDKPLYLELEHHNDKRVFTLPGTTQSALSHYFSSII